MFNRMDRHRAFMFLYVLVICVAGYLMNEALGELALLKQNRSAVDQLREENLLDLRRNGIHCTLSLIHILSPLFLLRIYHHIHW